VWNLPTYASSPKQEHVAVLGGDNPLLMRFIQPRGQRVRGYIAFDPPPASSELALRWFTGSPKYVFNHRPNSPQHAGWYRFVSPPGLSQLSITAKGALRVWVDGVEMQTRSTGGQDVDVVVPSPQTGSSVVAIRIEQPADSFGGDSITLPVRMHCVKGSVQLGDWSTMGLATYSGVGTYSRRFELGHSQVESKILLDLGRIAGTADVLVNGQRAGTLIAPPWRLDISAFVVAGENKLEVSVANTLANHYSVGIPTPYVFPGQTLSGLLGPVQLLTNELV
jgi:hypothetical protein